jgi:hypothetical protein
MKIYARIQNGMVAELVSTGSDVSKMFHPELSWVDVTSVTGLAEGWTYDGTTFMPPSPVPPPPTPTLAQLEAQLSNLGAQIAALSKSH